MLGSFFDQRTRRRKGGLLRARTINANVLSATGYVFTLPPTQMLAPVSFANKSGSANLSIPDANRQIMATAAIPAGQSQSISFEAISGDGVRVPYTVTLAVPVNVVLSDVALDTPTVIDTAPPGTVIDALNGIAPGATVSLIDDAGGRFALSGADIVVGLTDIDALATPTLSITVRQTHPDSANSPHDTVIDIAVESAVVGLSVTGTLDPAQFNVAYVDSLSVAGGTGPYSVSGLPAYGPAATVSGGTISFSGTPR